ncbi:DUF4390 domain-containing protein [Ramlibacter sp. 2FC]|uniref:DUF4390 domain-containing protein n=1 Tax=Ramlibacter sp. 2FC TaxID=2502188 RepID=UPI0014856621|nr:DUF4390 domain-containing protein [Ramlibacter sp. 2FC]
MTDFFTHCWKSARLSLLALLGGLWLATVAPAARAQTAAELSDFRLERAEGGLYLSASLRFELAPAIEDALTKGVAMHFVAEAELLRDRWYWYDRKVASAARYMRLAYQPLTRRWRLSSSPEPMGAVGQGVSFTQYYDSLSEALAAVRRISRWKIAEASEIEVDARHSVEFRFRLDVSQLPRPFQIGAAGQGEWNLSVSRNQRLGAEGGK